MTSLSHLFPDSDFKHHLTLRRGDPREYFRSQDASGHQVAERRRLLQSAPERHSALLAEGEPVLAEFAELARGWGLTEQHRDEAADAQGRRAQLIAVGKALEPDVLLLSANSEGKFTLSGGALCFPTGWALSEKLGHPLDFIHGVVPGLNTALASPIEQFLSKMKPGIAFLRDNWGISSTDELNQHPDMEVRAPQLPVALDRLWLRVEHQALVALPRTGGIVFGIRISNHRLDELRRDASTAAGLARALATMPDAMAAYKRLDQVRTDLVSALTG